MIQPCVCPECEAGPPPGRAAGSLRRKLSCLSPIVEHVGGAPGAGRDSALGTSNSGTASGSQDTDRWNTHKLNITRAYLQITMNDK